MGRRETGGIRSSPVCFPCGLVYGWADTAKLGMLELGSAPCSVHNLIYARYHGESQLCRKCSPTYRFPFGHNVIDFASNFKLDAGYALPSISHLTRCPTKNPEVGLTTSHAISVKAELYGLVITFVVLASLTLIARLYVRIQAKNQGLEDWLVVTAMVYNFVWRPMEQADSCF